jgi:hypothetical protein
MGIRDRIVRAIVGGPHEGGIHVYHSSPHDFDRFDWSKMGSGEGAQIRGKGFYFAEHPAVSGQGGQYWDSFQSRFTGAEGNASELLRQNQFDREKAIADYSKKLEDARNWKPSGGTETDDLARQIGEAYTESLIKDYEAERALIASGKPVGPRTYEVNLRTDPSKLLNLDVPIGQQSPYVEERLRSLGVRPDVVSLGGSQQKAYDLIDLLRGVKGQADWVGKDLAEARDEVMRATDPNRVWMAVRDFPDFYNIPRPTLRGYDPAPNIFRDVAPEVHQRLSEIKGTIAQRPAQTHVEGSLGGAVPTAEALRGVQIPGSRYLDAGSRAGTVTEGTSNYVVNDPGIIDIMKKYGIAAAPAGTIGMGALAGQDQYEAPP